jgi:hypothetical protein
VEPEEPLEACEDRDSPVVEDAPCAMSCDRCMTAGGEVCACWEGFTDSSGLTVWDCDSPPNFWATAG